MFSPFVSLQARGVRCVCAPRVTEPGAYLSLFVCLCVCLQKQQKKDFHLHVDLQSEVSYCTQSEMRQPAPHKMLILLKVAYDLSE